MSEPKDLERMSGAEYQSKFDGDLPVCLSCNADIDDDEMLVLVDGEPLHEQCKREEDEDEVENDNG